MKKKDNLIDVLEKKNKDTCALLTSNQSSIKELQSANADKQRVIDEMQKRISGLEADIANKTDKIFNSLQIISKLNSEIVEKEKIIESNRQTENGINELLDQIDLLKRRNEDLDVENSNLKTETNELKGKLANKENTIHCLEDRIKDLEEKNGIKPIEVIENTKSGSSPTTTTDTHDDYPKQRTIDTVVDVETGNDICSEDFFSQSESKIFRMRTELQKAIYLRHPKLICKYCGQMIKISGRKTERGVLKFFSHLRDSDDCDYKTTTGRTKREIEREKYSKCNEGERHKKLKDLLATFLLKTSGVTNVRTENTMLGNHPILNWRRPDVAVTYRGQEIVFELQLSSTFVSVITERDLFYRLNKKFIIWVFNFDDQSEHVNLNNMVVKDVYYNHKLNIFIFDKAAQEESNKRGELVLKCNWIKQDGSWNYPNINNSDELGGRFVSLNELTYSNDYKPYYYDAEKEYVAHNPSVEQRIISIEEENKKILEDLDKRLQEEEEALHDFNKRLERLKEAFEIDSEIKLTQKYLIGRQDGKVGLITFDGDIKIPFEYDSVDGRSNWIEAKKGDTVILFRRKNYEIVNEGLKYESLGDDIFRIAKYDGDDILWGLMDKRGEKIVEAKFSQIEVWNAEKQLLLVVRNGKYGIMNQHGIYVLNCIYDHIDYIDSNGHASITVDGKSGIIDDDCHFIEETTIEVGNTYKKKCLMGKWGIENTVTKECIVDCKYDELGSYRGNLLGINETSMKLFDVLFLEDCPVKVKLVGKNERGMLIFKVGSKEAIMNLRQQQKARKANINPNEATEMYISFVNFERDLIYLSATPVEGPILKKEVVVNDSDIALGTTVEGSVVHIDRNYIIIKSENEQTVYIHRSTWGDYSMTEFYKGQTVRVEKKGFDDKHNKHVWKILSV
ncbi:MAG: WG repeat-containing protein [Bacteroidaceae bacterium]|nr:WG repeat-containing protein [Bacteroidaceae bacterium]